MFSVKNILKLLPNPMHSEKEINAIITFGSYKKSEIKEALKWIKKQELTVQMLKFLIDIEKRNIFKHAVLKILIEKKPLFDPSWTSKKQKEIIENCDYSFEKVVSAIETYTFNESYVIFVNIFDHVFNKNKIACDKFYTDLRNLTEIFSKNKHNLFKRKDVKYGFMFKIREKSFGKKCNFIVKLYKHENEESEELIIKSIFKSNTMWDKWLKKGFPLENKNEELWIKNEKYTTKINKDDLKVFQFKIDAAEKADKDVVELGRLRKEFFNNIKKERFEFKRNI